MDDLISTCITLNDENALIGLDMVFKGDSYVDWSKMNSANENIKDESKDIKDTQIKAFIKEAGYDAEYVACNERILYHVLLDYYSDILRLKEFHQIEHTKTDKVMAYMIFWIVRRKPIQINRFSDEEKDIFVNERFDKYIDLLLYYFKYRQLNPQVIELIIELFKIGKIFSDV